MARYHFCVGINNYPSPNTLRGCVNDAKDWDALLKSKGSVGTVLLDEQATAQNIIDGLIATWRQAQSGDRLVWTYSGHGCQVKDTNGDEKDGLDECIVPVDFATVGVISDDLLGSIFTKMAEQKPDVQQLFIPDSCFSGTVERFVDFSGREALPRFMEIPDAKIYRPQRFEGDVRGMRSVSQVSTVTLFSGANDHETAGDSEFNGRPNGVFSYAALDALATAQPSTLRKWRTATAKVIGKEQHPTVEGKNAKLWQPI